MRYMPDSRLIRANFAVPGQKPFCRAIRARLSSPSWREISRIALDQKVEGSKSFLPSHK